MSDSTGLPKGWAGPAIEDVCSILAGFGFPNELQGRTDAEIPFFKVGDISEAWQRNEKQLLNAKHYVTNDDLHTLRAKVLPSGSVVFAKIGAAISLNRRAILGQPSLIDNNCMALHAPPDAL